MAKQKNVFTEYRNYDLPLSFPVLLLSGDYWRISDVPSGRLHFHNCLELGVCHSDSGFLEFYGIPTPFRAGDVTVIPRNVPHTTYSNPGLASHWSWLMLDPKALFRDLLPKGWKNYDLLTYGFQNYRYIFNKEEFPQIHQMLLLIIRALEEQKPGYQFAVRGLLLALYIEIYRIESACAPGEDTLNAGDIDRPGTAAPLSIAPALDYVENNYMQQFSIEYLAQLCHWSPTHFRRMFHEIMGTSPLDYVNSTRILKSCSLLCSTQESILNISEMVGFQSVSSYNRCFIKVMRISPREYRKQTSHADSTARSQAILEYSGWTHPE